MTPPRTLRYSAPPAGRTPAYWCLAAINAICLASGCVVLPPILNRHLSEIMAALLDPKVLFLMGLFTPPTTLFLGLLPTGIYLLIRRNDLVARHCNTLLLLTTLATAVSAVNTFLALRNFSFQHMIG